LALESHQPGKWNWQSRASCRGLAADLFFPSPEEDSSPAKLICAGCPVRLACLGFALERSEKYGIWGGLTERERSRLPETERRKIAADGRRLARELPAA
jgi:WhiB family redox-sensing transcriptional regulator